MTDSGREYYRKDNLTFVSLLGLFWVKPFRDLSGMFSG